MNPLRRLELFICQWVLNVLQVTDYNETIFPMKTPIIASLVAATLFTHAAKAQPVLSFLASSSAAWTESSGAEKEQAVSVHQDVWGYGAVSAATETSYGVFRSDHRDDASSSSVGHRNLWVEAGDFAELKSAGLAEHHYHFVPGDHWHPPSPIPEPSTYALLSGIGILGFAVLRRRFLAIAA